MPDPRPDEIVFVASMLRWEHYLGQAVKPLYWSQLTDAQKVPWLRRAEAELRASHE